MMLRRILMTLVFASVSSVALAASGTPEEQAACRPDVKKFCGDLLKKANAEDNDYLMCLENNRDKLSIKCLNVLLDHNR